MADLPRLCLSATVQGSLGRHRFQPEANFQQARAQSSQETTGKDMVPRMVNSVAKD